MTTIDLYFEFRSPDSYLAHSRLGSLSTTVDYHPIDMGFSKTSHAPIFSLPSDSGSRETMIYRRSRALLIGMAASRAAKRLRM
jgi:2-hydroxychromene-2-carboxylate isomerase